MERVETDSVDICIIGAGVIGLAIAYQLSISRKFKNKNILLLEQESNFGQQTSSRNSEVIHAGIYYPANSLKAELCVRGKELLYAYCKQFNIPFKRLGKLIVANDLETDQLLDLEQRAQENGVDDLQLLDEGQIKKLEPTISAKTALFSPSTGIIDSHSYMQSLLHQAQIKGVHFSAYSRVERVEVTNTGFLVNCVLNEKRNPENYKFRCRYLINSAGLQAQSIAENIDAIRKQDIPTLHYCKGEYFNYLGKNPFSHLIYPVPECNTTGLGIHATMDLASQLRFGPDSEYVDVIDYKTSAGKAESFALQIKKYFSAIDVNKLKPSYSGIRPKLSGPGQAAADFVVQDFSDHKVQGLVQLFGIESPGLTASLALAEKVAESLEV
jgi:L-2-hydroxyglutarate oxidase LhgO